MRKKVMSVFLAVSLIGMVVSGCGNASESEDRFEEYEDTEEESEREEIEEEKPRQEKSGENEQGMMTVYLPTRVVWAEADEGRCYIYSEHEYEYDNHGNIVKVSRYRADDEPWQSEEISSTKEEAAVAPVEEAPAEEAEDASAEEAAEAPAAEEAPAEEVTEEAPAEEAEPEVSAEEETYEEKAGPKAIEYDIDEIVAEAEKDIDGVTANDTLYEFEYEYDAVGRVIKKTKYSMWADSESSINKYLAYEDEYEYGEDGTPLKLKSTLFYEQEPEVGELPYDGEVHYVEELEYDEYGNRTKSLSTYPHENQDGSDKISGYIYDYEYDAEGRITEEVSQMQGRKEDGSMFDPFVSSHEYDERGNRIRTASRHISEDGTESEAGGHTIDYEYDSNDRLVKKTFFRFDNGETYTDEYTYDAGGHLTRLVCEDMMDVGGVTTVENTYDANGNIVRMMKDVYNERGNGEHDIREVEREYDTNGNIVRETSVYPDGDTRMAELEYDERGNIIRSIYTGDTGILREESAEENSETRMVEFEYEYDEKDNLIRETGIDSTGYRDTSEYAYDVNGNLIGETRYNSNANHVTIYRYEYTEMQIPEIESFHSEKEWRRDGTPVLRLPSAGEPEDLSEYWKSYVDKITLSIMEKDKHSEF